MKRMSRLARPLTALVAVLGLALLSSCTSTVAASPTAQAPTPPPPGGLVGALPRTLPDHFGIGVAAGLGSDGLNGWIPESGIPFDYTYQYLAGGVGPGSGWQTWMPNATFPLVYAKLATSEHHIPVLDYYMLLQSSGPCSNCSEAQKDLAHLNDQHVMADYFDDFATLMKRLGSGTWNGVKGFGGTVIVHIEPDLSGHAEEAVLDSHECFGYCTGVGNNPSLLRAAVASSGVGSVAGYPNTYLGFNLALLHLRDLYAPNVLLAYHLSNWSTRTDIGSSTNTHLNAAELGAKAGAFAAESGVAPVDGRTSTYNLVFNDVSDRDSQVSGIWWDATNRTYPNFARWESYVGSAAEVFKKPVFIWQVPLGNRWFRSENGSPGHTQDNRIEDFFAHPQQLMNAGIAAVLYGSGIANSTSNHDGDHDGVTNPPVTCNAKGGVYSCTTHVAEWADDDGGYLRIEASAYYRNPLPLSPAHS
jgi:hypothetical protein